MTFRKTAINLIVICLVTAGIVYAYVHFKLRKDLTDAIPNEVKWMYHFRTQRMETKVKRPAYLDSLIRCIRHMPVFKNITKPEDVGIQLHSDIVLFENQFGRYAMLSVNSEPRLKRFIGELMPKDETGPVIQAKEYNFVKAKNKHLYFAWKSKVCFFFIPSDTAATGARNEEALNAVFKGDDRHSIRENSSANYFYEENCDIIFYNQGNNQLASFGVKLDDQKLNLIAGENTSVSNTEPISVLHHAGIDFTETELNQYKTGQLKWTSYALVNLTIKAIFQYLKPYSDDKK